MKNMCKLLLNRQKLAKSYQNIVDDDELFLENACPMKVCEALFLAATIAGWCSPLQTLDILRTGFEFKLC